MIRAYMVLVKQSKGMYIMIKCLEIFTGAVLMGAFFYGFIVFSFLLGA